MTSRALRMIATLMLTLGVVRPLLAQDASSLASAGFNFTLSLVVGGADPGEVVRQVSGRTANFALGMLYLAYTY